MRLLIAGLFVIVCVFATVVLLGSVLEKGPVWVGVGVILTVLFESILVSLLLFNSHSMAAKNDSAWKLELEQQGLLEPSSFEIKRSLQVEEFEDEGSHYFLELHDGRVLYLSGQYLYDYEALDDNPRTFPSSAFTLRRHKEEGYVVDIICEGIVLEPEACAPPYEPEDFKCGRVPLDGEILTVDFNIIKAELLKLTSDS